MSGGEFSLVELFREEVRAHAATLTAGLLELEADPANPQRIEPLMRGAHSIKGAARIVDIDLAVELAHVMEDVFVAAGEGKIRITPADTDELLRGTDLLGELAGPGATEPAAWTSRHTAEIAALCQRLAAVARGEPRPQQPTAPVKPKSNATKSASTAPAVDEALTAESDVKLPASPAPSAAIDPACWAAIEIPDEPVAPGDDSPLWDLFREEVRAGCKLVAAGLQDLARDPDLAGQMEPLMVALRSVRGAARIVGVELVVQLAVALEEALAAVDAHELQPNAQAMTIMWNAIGLLAETIKLPPDGADEWTTKRAADSAKLIQELSASRTRAADGSAVAPAQTGAADTEAASALPESVPEVSDPREIIEQSPNASPALPGVETQPATAAPAAVEPDTAVVRVTASSLNRLMGLAGESLVQARWLQPFSTSLLKLKKQQDHLADLLDSLSQTLPKHDDSDELGSLVNDVRRRTASCRQALAERMVEFDDHAAQAEDLNSRLYREVIVSRMRPFSDGAHGFPRLVRDMARQLDKQVRLEIVGAEAEVDRDVLEKLEAPLTHLLRNAVDHGIETLDARRAAGKPETGLVKLEVRHRAGMLAITVSDDGGGLDQARISRKIVERRLTTEEIAKSLSAAEIFEFLFLPGFSTAPQVTEYSGRGVGLDVVQQSIRRIGGTVRVSSRLGAGTQFHLELPLTLSVLRAVLVDIDGEPYAFPHNRIDRLICVSADELRSLENRQFLVVDGENVGVVLAAQVLGMTTAPPHGELTVVLISDSVGRYGLIVDAFRGEQDLVVRPLDARLGKVPNISAAAILDDGSPVLIADVEDFIRSMDQYIQRGALRRIKQDGVVRGPSKRVLVVDDSITVREVERQILRNQGYDVTVAVDGQEGWNLVRSENFDLVISDVDMPRMNGLELVQHIRGEVALRNLPVIIVSYKERQEDRLRGMEVGANYYLTKSSFHDDTFLQAVKDCIGES